MPRALEALDHIVRRLEQGEIGALEAIDILLVRRADPAGEQPHQDCPAHGPPGNDQDPRRLRLLLPALARSRPHPCPGPARLHRPRRGRPLPRPARHRQEPPGDRTRRRSGQGRAERLLLHARRPHRPARACRAGGPPAGAHALLLPTRPPDRRRDRLPAGCARRRQPVLPARQRPL